MTVLPSFSDDERRTILSALLRTRTENMVTFTFDRSLTERDTAEIHDAAQHLLW